MIVGRVGRSSSDGAVTAAGRSGEPVAGAPVASAMVVVATTRIDAIRVFHTATDTREVTTSVYHRRS